MGEGCTCPPRPALVCQGLKQLAQEPEFGSIVDNLQDNTGRGPHLPTHGLNHLARELHGRREGLGVTAQDVAEVDVEQLACKTSAYQ